MKIHHFLAKKFLRINARFTDPRYGELIEGSTSFKAPASSNKRKSERGRGPKTSAPSN